MPAAFFCTGISAVCLFHMSERQFKGTLLCKYLCDLASQWPY